MALLPVTEPLTTMRLTIQVRSADVMDVQDALEAFIGERRVFNALLQIDRNRRGSLVATVRYGTSTESEAAQENQQLTPPHHLPSVPAVPPMPTTPAPGPAPPMPPPDLPMPEPQVAVPPTPLAQPPPANQAAPEALSNLLAFLSGAREQAQARAHQFTRPAVATPPGAFGFMNLPPRGTSGIRRGRPRLSTRRGGPSRSTAASSHEEDEDCCICHEEDGNKRLECGHYFHKKCLREVPNKTVCPSCEQPLSVPF